MTPAPPPAEALPCGASISQHVAVTLVTADVVPVTPAAPGPKRSTLPSLRQTDGHAAERQHFVGKPLAWAPWAGCATIRVGTAQDEEEEEEDAQELGAHQGASRSASEKAVQQLRLWATETEWGYFIAFGGVLFGVSSMVFGRSG